MAAVLVSARLCEPSSELHIAEDWYRRTALSDLLQLEESQVNKDRLYRALDELLHKAALEAHLARRCGELFAIDNEVLLMAMVMLDCMHVEVTSRAVQDAMMATRSVMAGGCMATPRSMKATCSMVTATMRLCLGRDSQADGAHQEECNQELGKDASHMVLLALIQALSRRTLSLRSLR